MVALCDDKIDTTSMILCYVIMQSRGMQASAATVTKQ